MFSAAATEDLRSKPKQKVVFYSLLPTVCLLPLSTNAAGSTLSHFLFRTNLVTIGVKEKKKTEKEERCILKCYTPRGADILALYKRTPLSR